jgi:dihydroxyacetone kinase-like predicted kinase
VTCAVRNTKTDRFEIKQGEIIGMDEKNTPAEGKFLNEVTLKSK